MRGGGIKLTFSMLVQQNGTFELERWVLCYENCMVSGLLKIAITVMYKTLYVFYRFQICILP